MMKKEYLLPQLKIQRTIYQDLCANELEVNPSAAGWEIGSGDDVDTWGD